MPKSFRFQCVLWLAGLLLVTRGYADSPVDFNRDIRPILFSKCVSCHGPDEDERAAGLRLDTEAGATENLGGYAAIVPGDPDESELLVRVMSEDEDLRMPPSDKGSQLSGGEIELLSRWIKQGGQYAKHWSYETLKRPELPTLASSQWVRNPIDAFVLAKLQAAGYQPSPEADRYTLARRLAIDLTGLPPTWQEAEAFVSDTREDAYTRYVDQLLAKPAFGERWARVWLDLARYADSAGYADDPPRTIWAYRDYVIESLNANKPFDQFTIEQIAGDLLPDPSDEQLIATAFHRNTMTNNEGGTNDEEFRNVAVVDRVNTTMAVWMGTTMACAQCHTHKYDPITHEEYFKLFAIFNNTEDRDLRDERPIHEYWTEDQKTLKDQLQQEIERLELQLTQSTPQLEQQQSQWLQSLKTPPLWMTLIPESTVDDPQPEALSSTQNRSLAADAEGWITASGEKPEQDTYTISFPVTEQTLAGVRIEISDQQKSNFVLSQISGNWTPSTEQAVPARFVRVELPGKNRILHLAEIEVFSEQSNVALGGIATQSSTGYDAPANRAIDGNTDGDFNQHSVTHTNTEENPWIEIDLGDTKPIDRIVLWNRTDGGDGIQQRLMKYNVQLLSDDRDVLWQQSPEEVPKPKLQLSASGARELKFAKAFADFEQNGFPASSVIAQKAADTVDPQTGWAIGSQTGRPHELTLVLESPMEVADGVLTLTLTQSSAHAKHLIDHFRVSVSGDTNLADWAAIPQPITKLILSPEKDWTSEQQDLLAEYYRSIAPALDPMRRDLESAAQQLNKMKPYTTVPVMQELPDDKRRITHVQLRGNYLSLGQEVTEGTPEAFHPIANSQHPDRLDLAYWLVDDNNPLTPRVIANRHWEEIFGIGIVETSEEFGSQGELPSHPELLDWLAVQLRDSGWNLKELIKLLVSSATYRQSSIASPTMHAIDPQNRFLTRGPRFRASAEIVRDQALFVSGLLSDSMFGPGVNPPKPDTGLKAAFGGDTDWKTSKGSDRYRRGIYTTWRRSSPYPSMAQFDAPTREVCTVRRIRTNTPLQALVTMNDPVYVEAAQALARQMIQHSGDIADRIQFAFRTCLIRGASDAELDRLEQLAEQAYEVFAADPPAAKQMATEPLGDLDADADLAEHAAWTVVGNVILNLDEFLMKR